MPSREYRSLRERYTLFTWSQPVGYDFEEVENTIEQYKATISELGELLRKREEMISSMKNEIKRLTSDLTDAQLQMTAISIPEASDGEIDSVLSDFGLSIQDAENDVIEIEDDGLVEPPQEQQKSSHKGINIRRGHRL